MALVSELWTSPPWRPLERLPLPTQWRLHPATSGKLTHRCRKTQRSPVFLGRLSRLSY